MLDVGCGTGDLAAVFARRGLAGVYGIEPSRRAAELAREAGVEAVNGTLADAPWEDGNFDAIVFNHSLEHIDDPAEALAIAARLLRPGGLLAIAVPNFGSWHRRLFGSAWFQLDLPRHLQHFDRASLAAAGAPRAACGPSPPAPPRCGPAHSAASSTRFGDMRYEGRWFRVLAWVLRPSWC